MHESKLIIKNRTAGGGSLILLPQDIPANIDLTHYKLSKSARQTVNSLLASSALADDQGLVSVQEFAAQSGEILHTVRNRLRTLRSKGLLQSVPFQFSDGSSLPRITCDVLLIESHEDYLSRTVDHTDDSSKTHKIATTINNNLTTQREKNRNMLAEKGFNLPKFSKGNTPAVLRHLGNNPVEQLINTSNRKKGRSAITNKVADAEQAREIFVKASTGTKKIITRVRSFMNIMDGEDLQVLYATYALVYNYHRNELEKHRKNGTSPKNLTPIHIDQIIDMIGRSRGGPNRMHVRDCLQAIIDTEYDLHGLAEVELDDITLHGYARHSFRNFSYLTPLTETEPEIDPDTGRVVFGLDATIYLVSLPNNVFDLIMKEDQLFAFPEKSLAVPAILFTLYLRFRALCHHGDLTETLKNMYRQMSGGKTDLGSFKKALKSAFRSLDKKKLNDPHLRHEYVDELNEIHFNLWGYRGRISFKEEYLKVTCHVEEMLKCCKATSENSPIVNNIMSELYQVEHLNKRISRQMSSVVSRRFKKFSVIYGKKQNTIELCKYVSKEEKEFVVDRLCSEYQLNSMAVEVQIDSDIDAIQGLVINNSELSKEHFDFLLESIGINPNTLEVLDLIQRINRRTSLHTEIHRVVFDRAEASMKLIRTLKEIEEDLQSARGINQEYLQKEPSGNSRSLDNNSSIEDADYSMVVNKSGN
ncbi:replication initiator protein RctB domain-containing protein [Vibrio sinus]|uniref:replication initiator protein RctB domain-containing protein n=1 Tax=Vibrio sinus TaxID=2946865 RepID=UPI003D7D5ADD